MNIWTEEQWTTGVLSKRQLIAMIEKGHIKVEELREEDVDYSSIDLHLSDEAYEVVNGTIKPCGADYSVFLREEDYATRLEPDENAEFKLKAHKIYLFRLQERLSYSLANSGFYGQATAKSSIGRLDVIARTIINGMNSYEELDPTNLGTGSGEIYLEIIPITFNIKVKKGTSLTQLRLFYGRAEDATINYPEVIKSFLYNAEGGIGLLSVNLTNTEVGGVNVAAFSAVGSR